jgi:hypothetical protein
MRRIILACALAGILSVPAKADEMLKWRHVQYTASNQAQQVGDVNGHVLAVYRLAGMAFFPDGGIGTSSVIGASDTVPSAGTTHNGYYTVNFADGSALWLKYTGTSKLLAPGKFENKGTAIVIGGKGRYEGAKGEGTWEGISTQGAVANDSAVGYIDNVINIKK